jgi:adenosylcobinamide-phosphate synthase
MTATATLLSAFLLDLAIGDPPWLPHPVRIMGKGIIGMEKFLRACFGRGKERIAGVLLVTSIVVPVYLLLYAVQVYMHSFTSGMLAAVGTVVLVYLTSTTLALRELVTSSKLVINAVREGALEKARTGLSMIVGRDTEHLQEEGILRAAIETLAENLSDGFVAPLFYFVIGGLPLAMAYKAVNTLDSMVGYKNDRYISFGWASAKLDDAANFIPARITGAMIVLAVFCHTFVKDARNACIAARLSYTIMLRDGRNHTSPNSGVPEAAIAGALNVKLGGPSLYGGKSVQKPWIGDDGTPDYSAAAGCATILAVLAAFFAIATAVLFLNIGVLL